MSDLFDLIEPGIPPPLDSGFRPPVLANRNFLHEVEKSGEGVPLVIALEGSDGAVSRFETRVYHEIHTRARANLAYAERIFKFLLWSRGGWRAYIGGPRSIGEHIAQTYAPKGVRAYDYYLLGESVYGKQFEVVVCRPSEVPEAREKARQIGRHLDGCRIGFDLGASDRKVSAVIDGKAVWSEEIIWDPQGNPDPEYHFREIMKALHDASLKLPRLDAIGGSAAGIYVDNVVRVASLFRRVRDEDYPRARELFLRIADEVGVPFEVANDGDVTALAGSMSLEDNGVLGIALGSSEACGYVDVNGSITGWLNELAFAPVDYQPEGVVDEWSGDMGCGAQYFSQQAVFRLAPKAGILLPADMPPAERLQFVQDELESGHKGARRIWESIGVYLGYTLAHYADFYDIRHFLILGRCTSGRGGEIILDMARQVVTEEFPELGEKVTLQLPDEKSRRVGQAIAAASLPALQEKRGQVQLNAELMGELKGTGPINNAENIKIGPVPISSPDPVNKGDNS